jgi:hypothetical protein
MAVVAGVVFFLPRALLALIPGLIEHRRSRNGCLGRADRDRASFGPVRR